MRILLHTCCAPCSTYVVELLRKKYEIVAYFYNPNIHPKLEYELRLENMIRLAEIYDIQLIVGEYDVKSWFDAIRGLEGEKEGGRRCRKCFELRLKETANLAKELGIGIFATTLTVSPHKNAQTINLVGREISDKYNIEFLEADFKKKDGFKKSVELSRKLGLYRQDYCGCIYSIRERI
ncbi:MAG: hypothetical protein DRN25_00495 [Thermoplasmata archaeon]|nr:MAG: hypothetical protein DRN25_00495 [Thermoplasmata archaeon]